MKAYMSLMLNNTASLKTLSSKNCNNSDGLSCWINLQLNIWENFGLTIQRDDPIHTLNDIDIDNLKISTGHIPIEEKLIVDQADIEELDSLDIKITPVIN